MVIVVGDGLWHLATSACGLGLRGPLEEARFAPWFLWRRCGACVYDEPDAVWAYGSVVILVARGSWLHVLFGQGAGWLEIFLHVCSGGAAARLVRGVILVARGSCDW